MKHFLLILLITFASIAANAQIRTNFKIADSLFAEFMLPIIRADHGNSSITISTNKHQSVNFVKSAFLLSSKSFPQLTFTIDNDSAGYKFFIRDFSVILTNHAVASDSVVRSIRLNALFENSTINHLANRAVDYIYMDTLSRRDLELVNKNQQDFLTAKVPKPDKSFFEEIAVPAIIITSAIISVVLLFTVRS